MGRISKLSGFIWLWPLMCALAVCSWNNKDQRHRKAQIKQRFVSLVLCVAYYGNQSISCAFQSFRSWRGSPALSHLLLFPGQPQEPLQGVPTVAEMETPPLATLTQYHMSCRSLSCREPFLIRHSSTGGSFLAAHPSGTFHTHCAFSSWELSCCKQHNKVFLNHSHCVCAFP